MERRNKNDLEGKAQQRKKYLKRGGIN